MVEVKTKSATYNMKGYVEFFVEKKFTKEIKDILRDIVFDAIATICDNKFTNYEADFENVQKDCFGTYCRYNFSLEEDAMVTITEPLCSCTSFAETDPPEEEYYPELDDYDSCSLEQELSEEIRRVVDATESKKFAVETICVGDLDVEW